MGYDSAMPSEAAIGPIANPPERGLFRVSLLNRGEDELFVARRNLMFGEF